MSAHLRTCALLGALALLVGAGASRASAQLPGASAAGLGFADNYTAASRGYNAVALNPANLALSGNPGASLAFFPVRVIAGLGPVNLGDIKTWGGKIVPIDVRTGWFQRIQASGHEQGDAGVDMTIAALQVGPVGFQLSSTLHGTADLTPDAAKLVLFGNELNGA